MIVLVENPAKPLVSSDVQVDEIKTHQRGRGGVLRSAKTGPIVFHAIPACHTPPGHRPGGSSPCRLANSPTATFAEILEKLNPPLQNRSSPRVVKRVHVHAYRAKRSGDTATLYPAPPNIRILAVA
jgi:hypothetical protein